MITLSNGHSFEYVAASGALAYRGNGWWYEQPLRMLRMLRSNLFTVTIKTLTATPRKGNLRWYNPFRAVRFLPGGAVNAVGLTNPGIHWWCDTIGPHVRRDHQPLIGSILSDDPGELADMAGLLNTYDLVGLEINASCPNTKDDLLHNSKKVIESVLRVKEKTCHPLLVKLSVVHDLEAIVPALSGVVEAFSLNSVPWAVLYPTKHSPLARFGGGAVSGKVTQSIVWNTLECIARLSSTPVIGSAIWDFGDIARVRNFAHAVSFGSIFLRYPWRPTQYVLRDMRDRGQSGML